MKKWLPPIAAAVIFFVLLIFFFVASAASRPKQVPVVAAAHPLKPGDVLTAADLQVAKVYEDARVTAYIPIERQQDLIGGVVLQPFDTGEPLTKLGIASIGTADTRLMGLLADFPDMAIFPLPLDLHNVVAGNVDDFHVGDIVSLTVVYIDRPSLPENPAAPAYTGGLTFGQPGAPTPTPAITPTPTPSLMDYTERGKPPVAKTFSTGYRVVAVVGQSQTVMENQEDQSSPYTMGIEPPRPMLMLLVPQKDIEPLSLAVTQGQVFVSLALKVHPPEGGFSYWDFEQMLQDERKRLLGGTPTLTVTAAPTGATPSATPLPFTPTPQP